MKLPMIRYHTMNSWNLAQSPAFNLKVYRVIPSQYQDKVLELMDADNFYDDINDLLREFDEKYAYEWQAGFNGRSGGYLVLYQGGRRPSDYKRICRSCGQKNYDANAKVCGRCTSNHVIDYKGFETFTYPGRGIETKDVPKEVLKSFRKLARGIVNNTIQKAKHCRVREETYYVPKTRKVLTEA